MQGLYKVFFKDGEEFNGGSLEDTRWSDMPDGKEISRLEYLLPDGNILVLQNYERYCHIVEVVKDFIGGNGLKIENIYVIGEKNGVADSYRITLHAPTGERYQARDITSRSSPVDKIYHGKPVGGWKGIKR